MKRYRWFKVQWPMPMPVLAKQLKVKLFQDDSMDGFLIDRVRDDFVEARFFQKASYTATIVDPFGRESNYEHLHYTCCEFMASCIQPGLELLNAPRSINGFVSRLLEVSNFSISVQPIQVNVYAWADKLLSCSEIEFTVDSLQIGSIILERGTTAKALIMGNKDVRQICDTFLSGKKYTIEKLRLNAYGRHHGTIVITNTGTARIAMEEPDMIADALRRSLSAVC